MDRGCRLTERRTPGCRFHYSLTAIHANMGMYYVLSGYCSKFMSLFRLDMPATTRDVARWKVPRMLTALNLHMKWYFHPFNGKTRFCFKAQAIQEARSRNMPTDNVSATAHSNCSSVCNFDLQLCLFTKIAKYLGWRANSQQPVLPSQSLPVTRSISRRIISCRHARASHVFANSKASLMYRSASSTRWNVP